MFIYIHVKPLLCDNIDPFEPFPGLGQIAGLFHQKFFELFEVAGLEGGWDFYLAVEGSERRIGGGGRGEERVKCDVESGKNWGWLFGVLCWGCGVNWLLGFHYYLFIVNPYRSRL